MMRKFKSVWLGQSYVKVVYLVFFFTFQNVRQEKQSISKLQM